MLLSRQEPDVPFKFDRTVVTWATAYLELCQLTTRPTGGARSRKVVAREARRAVRLHIRQLISGKQLFQMCPTWSDGLRSFTSYFRRTNPPGILNWVPTFRE
jgi:hypothetical protein